MSELIKMGPDNGACHGIERSSALVDWLVLLKESDIGARLGFEHTEEATYTKG